MNNTETVRLGRKAQQLLDDPTLIRAFDQVEAGLYKGIAESSFEQSDEREDAYRMLRALTSLKGKLESAVRISVGIQSEQSEVERVTVKRLAER